MGLKSFFGIGRGKLQLQLPQTSFMSGQTIQGNIVLNLKKPIDSNYTEVVLIAQERRTSVGRDGHRDTDTVTVFENRVRLAEAKRFEAGTLQLPFSIPIPADISGPQLQNQTLQKVAAVANALGGRFGGRRILKWYVSARIDVPKAIDMRSRKTQVYVTQSQAADQQPVSGQI